MRLGDDSKVWKATKGEKEKKKKLPLIIIRVPPSVSSKDRHVSIESMLLFFFLNIIVGVAQLRDAALRLIKWLGL